MKKVWAVVHGEYSDHQISCVCLTEELANKLVAQMNEFPGNKFTNAHGAGYQNEYSVEEYQLFEEGDRIEPRAEYMVEVSLATGEEVCRYFTLDEPWSPDADYIGDHVIVHKSGFISATSTRSYEAALKAAHDKRAEELARRAGL